MKRTPNLRRSFAFALAAVATAGAAWASEVTKVEHQSIPASGHVKIENLAGSLEVRQGTGGAIEVEAKIHAEGRSAEETQRLLAAMAWREERGSWVLTYPVDDYDAFAYPDGGDSWWNDTNSRYRGTRVRIYGTAKRGVPVLFADVTVTVPAGADLALRNVVGSVRGGDLVADLGIDTGSGDAKFGRLAGQIDVDTGSGDVLIDAVDGSLKVDTGSGEVKIGEVAVDRLDVDTGSGNVWIGKGRADDARLDTGSGDITIQAVAVVDAVADTGSGDVRLAGDLSRTRRLKVDTGSGDVEIAGGEGFEFDLDTDLGSGDVRVDYDDATLRYERREVVGATRGSGRSRILVDTGSGDCTLRP
ncbi:MAG: DUF4097 family beta strand repeat-containing protein [Thermoanaerobaculia bacterium]